MKTSSCAPSPPREPKLQTLPPPKLIIDDSINSDIKSKPATTLSYPGAKVADLMLELPGLLTQDPTAEKVVRHIGTNDIPQQQYELLK